MNIKPGSLTVTEILAIYGIRVQESAPWFSPAFGWGEPPSNKVYTRRAKKTIYHRSHQEPDVITWELILHEGVHLILQRLNLEIEEDEIDSGVFALQYFLTYYIKNEDIYNRSMIMLREIWQDTVDDGYVVSIDKLAKTSSQRLFQLGLIDSKYKITWQRPNHASRICLKAS